jgi:hypothetical protein
VRGPGDAWSLRLAAALVLGPSLTLAATSAQDPTAELQSRVEHETDAVHKAKLMQQLGADQFQEMRGDLNGGDFPDAVRVLDQYRDEARSCVKALDAKKTDAAKHPSGFKQLQISLQEALRQLDEMVAGLTVDQQPEFASVRGDLQKMNDHLVKELFPSSPAADAPAEKGDH